MTYPHPLSSPLARSLATLTKSPPSLFCCSMETPLLSILPHHCVPVYARFPSLEVYIIISLGRSFPRSSHSHYLIPKFPGTVAQKQVGNLIRIDMSQDACSSNTSEVNSFRHRTIQFIGPSSLLIVAPAQNPYPCSGLGNSGAPESPL